METPIRAAVIGLVHERVWTKIQQALDLPYAELVAAADPNEALLERFREMTGCPADALYRDVSRLFAEHDVQAVIGGLLPIENSALAELCAKHGVALLVNKPLTAEIGDMDAVVTAVQRSEIPFMVDYPRFWQPALREAVQMVEQGAIGRIVHVHYRLTEARTMKAKTSEEFGKWLFNAAHNPDGVYTDLAGYGAQLAAWALGQPQSVTGVAAQIRRENPGIHDAIVLTMKYPRAIVVLEAAWTKSAELAPRGPEFRGENGLIAVREDRIDLYNDKHPTGTEVAPRPPVPGYHNGVEHFFYSLLHQNPFTPSADLTTAHGAEQILEAGRRSIETGFECPLPVR